MHRLLKLSQRVSSAYRFSEVAKFKNNFLSPANVAYIESQYLNWTNDKNSVSASFQAYFEQVENGVDIEEAFTAPPARGQKLKIVQDNQEVSFALKLKLLVDAYRLYGHQFAQTDPLQYNAPKFGQQDRKVLDYRSYGFTEQDLDKDIRLEDASSSMGQSLEKVWKLRSLIDYLEKVYCSKIGFEYMHLHDKIERNFVREKIENLGKFQPTKQAKLATFERLCHEQAFTDYLGKKFANYKRFGVEGLNATIGALGELVNVASREGTEYMVLGMAHRGRLNTLHCVFEKPAEIIFQEFMEIKKEIEGTSGDVKYHLGITHEKVFPDNRKITLSIVPNPSHLEAVDPLVYGRVRAIQDHLADHDQKKAVGVLIHGDAAVAGQGVVYESLEMQDLKDYTTGGIIHIVMNNQVGFTTDPIQARSTYYCTDIAKVVNAPVFHVNADEPDLLDKCMEIAYEYRQKFHKDIFIDIIGYRKYGHNEQDQPFFTQPLMYEKIKTMPNVYEKYSAKLIKEGLLTQEAADKAKQAYLQKYEAAYKLAMENTNLKNVWAQNAFSHLKEPTLWGNNTGVPRKVLTDLIQKVTQWPADFNIHPTIKKIYEERIKNFNNNDGLDMATMESLAFGSLLTEGFAVRLSGQDVERGTFSHRHALISDQKVDKEKYTFLKAVSPNITICNSHLSEFGILGFEYGYSITNPNSLVIWEAQFGDFANGAQVIIDNFVTSAQTKWQQTSGIVLNLPHGMDGQGPEHSSARIERFLQASDDSTDYNLEKTLEQQLRHANLQAVCCSTTANYFHVLRRQLRRNFRKPLVLFNSKKLLKLRSANSKLEAIEEGTDFVPVYDEVDNIAAPEEVAKVLLCTGQFYYDLKNYREEHKQNNVAIVRIQQLAPLPHNELAVIFKKYSKAEFFWVQEEHENQGAWSYLRPRLKNIMRNALNRDQVYYAGRKPLAASAGGTLKNHKKEEAEIMTKLFGGSTHHHRRA